MNREIIFNGMKGTVMNSDGNYMQFLQQVCNIDTSNYTYIYKLDDGWAGSVLLVKADKSYLFFKCGSGVPIIAGSKRTGTL